MCARCVWTVRVAMPSWAPISRDPLPLGGGFGAEVQHALERRAERLVSEGLAERQNRGVSFSPNLIETLRRRELDDLAGRIAAEAS